MKQAIQNLTNRITRVGLALFIAFWQLAVPLMYTQSVKADEEPVFEYTYFCHQTNSASNPYSATPFSTGYSEVNGGGQSDHSLHTGEVFDPSIHNQQNRTWGDIIPPVPGLPDGLNWTAEGQAIWNNDCEIPTPVQYGSVTVNKQVDTDGDGVFNELNVGTSAFTWGLDADSTDNVMGTTQDDVAVGDHEVHENDDVDGYQLVGWYINGTDGVDCSSIEGRNEGAVTIEVVANETTEVTLCNQATSTEEPEVYEISGFKFHDRNKNGEHDEAQDEEKLARWTVFIDNNANGTLDDNERSDLTDDDGHFSFGGAVDGTTYRVCEVQQAGWVRMFPAASDCQDVTVSGEDETDVRFGNYQIDPCDYQQLLAATTRGDAKARLTQLGVTGEDCFDVEISSECSVLDVKVQHTVRNGNTPWNYAAYHKLTDLKPDGTFPLIFDEDYNNGSVSVDWQVLGTENDYVSLWEATGSEVVDTDCDEPVVPTPEEPKTPGQVLGDNTDEDFKPQVLSANTLANTGEKYDVRQTVFAGTIIIAATAMGFTSRRKQTDR